MAIHGLMQPAADCRDAASRNSLKPAAFAAYGIDFPEMWRHGATFVDKILKGAKPADVPVEQATKFVTVVRAKSAKVTGVEIPTSLLLRADKVLE